VRESRLSKRPAKSGVDLLSDVMREAGPLGGAWSLLPPTTEMPRGESGSAEIPPDSPLTLVLGQLADIEISISTSRQSRHDSYLVEACHLSAPRAIFRRFGFSVQISPRIDVGVRTSLMLRPMLARRINSDKRYNPGFARTKTSKSRNPVSSRPWRWLALVRIGYPSLTVKAPRT
jgi:hypothetical protein